MIYTVHGFHFAQKALPGRAAGWLGEQWAIRNAEQVIFVCEYDLNLAKRTCLLPRNKPHHVIYNGIPEPLVSSVSKKKLGVGFVGRMVYQKNPELFVETMTKLPNAKAVMVGGGELEDSVRSCIEENGLADRIDLRGSLEHAEALEVLANCELLLMTPRWEGLPLLPLEAMFLDVPVVSTAVGGVPEIITDGKNGMLAGESAVELADRVSKLLDDEALRDEVVKNAAQQVADQFGQDTMIDRLREVYGR